MKQLKNNPQNVRAFSDATIPMLDENLFQRMLLLERRRCERTGVPFALVLLEMQDVSRTVSVSAMEEIGTALGGAMRETDITGWYVQSSTIGILLTTLNGTDRVTIESIIAERVKRVLSRRLLPTQVEKIRMSCHLFPEKQTAGDSNQNPSRKFYSDHKEKDYRNRFSTIAKKIIDVSGSLAFLAVFSPIFIVIALLIKATSPGPVFFRQKRLGQFGEEFTFLKFRSMVANNDPAIHQEYIRNLIEKKVDASGGTFKIQNDPRVTRVGRILRRTSLDELPQFINVLRGDMSLVGPRPALAYEFERYSLWHRRRLLEAKPGITGAWQVEGRSRTTFDEMVRMDLRYIRNQSLWLDIKILLKTPFAMISGNGAY
jgi:exopolysaccharide biosynthesis polyprenyl glycosylphosphotransferase